MWLLSITYKTKSSFFAPNFHLLLHNTINTLVYKYKIKKPFTSIPIHLFVGTITVRLVIDEKTHL